MVQIDQQEERIIRELIKNPRISDNKISKNTGIPVMTVNRKRKNLETRGLISYYADFCHGEHGTQDFYAKQLYIIKFKVGITREQFLNYISEDKKYQKFMSMYTVESYLGEKDGRLSLITIMNGKNIAELVEILNSTIFNMFRDEFGDDSIRNIMTARITDLIRTHHNYLPLVNMKDGTIKKDWPDEWIFVTRESYGIKERIGKQSDF
ncbi:winged helix-turn-helix transcriptional regulator [Candidatus Woesearchaeota archaeon]|nr:winged helix-turn-helix transcriptional regulator [Candidatus Woesearchaeota archaeon]